jgi:hypothetical protein
MFNKKFAIIIAVLVVGFGALVVFNKLSKPSEPMIGTQHKSLGSKHIARGQSHDSYNSDPASSGPHYADSSSPTPWGVYTEEVPDEVFLHNEEHGGIVITYNPKLLTGDKLKKLQALFAPPYSNKDFHPRKFIITPRSKDTHAIEVAAWTWTMNLDNYDEMTLIKFFNQHAGKAPEPAAGPANSPINQASGV